MSPRMTVCRYSVSNGVSTFSPEDVKHLFACLCAERLDAYLFSDGSIRTVEDFSMAIHHNDVWFYAGYDAHNTPLGVVALDTFKGTTAHIHFAFFRAGLPIYREISRHFMQLLFANGLTAVFGCTSVKFRNVCAVARDMGFVEVARVPGYHAWFNRRTNSMEYHDAFVGLCTPASLQAVEQAHPV